MIYCTWADLPPSLLPTGLVPAKLLSMDQPPPIQQVQLGRGRGRLRRYLVQLCKCQSAALPSKTGRATGAGAEDPSGGRESEDVYDNGGKGGEGRRTSMEIAHFEIRHERTAPMSYQVLLNGYPWLYGRTFTMWKIFPYFVRKCFSDLFRWLANSL